MKVMNGNNKIFNVKKSFTIGNNDNQIIVMEGDQLKHMSTDTSNGNVKVCFIVINSFWCNDVIIELTPHEVTDKLVYSITYR